MTNKIFKMLERNQFKLINERLNIQQPINPQAKSYMIKVLNDAIQHFQKCNTYEELGSLSGMNIDTNTSRIDLTLYPGFGTSGGYSTAMKQSQQHQPTIPQTPK